ncbi:unnamed protein product [Effrenium voratum]|nr:unnamed protein product [Effrenium voratum]
MSNIGTICRQQGNYQAAADWYRAVLRLSPNCETTPMNLAVSLINHGLQIKASDPKGAIRCYREALVHCPTNANAYYNLGVSYAELHKYDKALINYQLTVHFDPRCAEAYNNMGVIFKEQENLEKALKFYHMAIQCNPRFAQTLNNLGVAYTTSGRLTEALEYLSRAVSVAPNYVAGSETGRPGKRPSNREGPENSMARGSGHLNEMPSLTGHEVYLGWTADSCRDAEAEAYNNLGWLFWDHGDLAQARQADWQSAF